MDHLIVTHRDGTVWLVDECSDWHAPGAPVGDLYYGCPARVVLVRGESLLIPAGRCRVVARNAFTAVGR